MRIVVPVADVDVDSSKSGTSTIESSMMDAAALVLWIVGVYKMDNGNIAK